MAETEFSQADIDGLGEKLERLDLSDTERALLAALLALATDRVGLSNAERVTSAPGGDSSVVVHDDLPDLRAQLAQAFSPGVRAEEWRAVRVSIGPGERGDSIGPGERGGGSIGPGAREGSIGPGG
jgi:hypothetical protein